ncbi:MAG: acyl-CoA dehydrogenase [candidate division FCPU426 bacterium]
MQPTEFLAHARQYLQTHIAPFAETIETAESFPRDYLAVLGAERAFGVAIPETQGGWGLSCEVLRDLIFQVGLLSPTLAVVMGIPVFTTHLVASHGQGRMIEDLLPRLIRGEALCAFAYSELKARDSGGFVTRALPAGDGYVLSGEKNLISLAGVADYYLVAATLQRDEHASRPAVFLIPKDRKGVRFSPPRAKMAFPGLVLADVFLDEVRVGAEEMLGRPGWGLKIANEGLQLGRLCVGTVALAMSQTMLEASVRHARQPRGSGRLADWQTVQFALAEMKLDVEACRGLINEAWRQWAEGGEERNQAVALAKIYASRAALNVANRALQLAGGTGYLQGHPWERWFRQARVFSLVEGSDEFLLDALANRLLGSLGAETRKPGEENGDVRAGT